VKNYPVIFAACSALLFLHSVHANTVADWTFENYYLTNAVTGTDSPSLTPAIGAFGAAAWGHHASASSTFSDTTGNGSTHSLDADHWSIGDYFEFQTSTLGSTNISVSFDQFRSATGPTNWDFEYSTDGSFFTTALTYCTTNSPAWSVGVYHSACTFSINLSSVTALANDTSVYFRLVDDSAPNGTSGASRVDNFIVSGNPIPVPEPSAAALLGLAGLLGLPLLRHLRR
jgi:hypothetical protein